ncbi:MAG: tetratricopeptide repeat protein [Chloroflexota bacterium]|nr:tetratricopeptide repeat protein [Chloroflexota bacterium]
MTALPTGTVTFLFTDIEGSTTRWEQHRAAMQTALARHDTILRDAIEGQGGTVFKTVGDGFYAVFTTATDALAAALAAQQALQQEPWPEVLGPVRVRMALHTGTAEQRAGDYFGPSLNRVARLLNTGHGGQTLLSVATHGLLRDQLPAGMELRDLGEHRLKDLQQPEHIFQLVATGLPADFPPLRTLTTRPNNLPAQSTLFVGHEQDVLTLTELLVRPEVRLLTLTGPGGTGKTRLSLQVASELLDHFVDGVFFVALAHLSDPALVVPTIAQTLALQEAGGRPLLQLLQEYLRDKQVLLVLDNFEQIMLAAPVVADLLAGAPRLTILVSSRECLHIYGEKEFAVPPLGVPALEHLPSVDKLTMYAAVRLFVERAQDARHDFRITPENAPAIAEICSRLDGLPLAIELAAARVRLLPPQAILGRLASRLTLLTGGARNLPERQQTLRRAIDWSHDLLDERDKLLFRRLAVFAGGCTFEAVAGVCDPDGTLVVDVLDGVESLVNQSLLRETETTSGEPRFTMLQTICEYALERLEASGEAATLQHQHAGFYLALAEEAEPHLKGAQQVAWLERLETEHDNLRAALHRSMESGDTASALRLAGALAWFWRLRGYLTEGRAWLDRALALPEAAERSLARARALSGAGTLAMLQGDLGTAQDRLEESIELFRAWKDQRGLAFALRTLGIVQQFRGDLAGARALHEQSIALYREEGDRWGIAMARMMLGFLALRQGDLTTARSQHEASLALFRDVQDRWFVAVSLNNLGDVVRMQGDYGQAATYYEESLALFRAVGSRRDGAALLHNLAYVAHYQGDDTRAERLAQESLALQRELGNTEGMTEGLITFARIAGAQRQAERAARLLGSAEALREAIGALAWPAGRAEYERSVAEVRAQLDDVVFATCWTEGRAMTLEQAIAYALEPTAT